MVVSWPEKTVLSTGILIQHRVTILKMFMYQDQHRMVLADPIKSAVYRSNVSGYDNQRRIT